MRDSKPQDNVQQHKPLSDTKCNKSKKDINEASKQTFANNLFKMSCENTQRMFSNWKICFNVNNIRTYDELLCKLNEIIKTVNATTDTNFSIWCQQTTKTTSKSNTVSLDQSANFGLLTSLVCVTVSHNVAFKSITC